MKLQDIWDSKWFYRVLALLLAIGLFAYVNTENINNTRQNAKTDSNITETAKRTIKVPLQINGDTDKYFITGYPENVNVAIEGSQSLVTMTANTQNFRVVADLTKLGVGTHTVKLRAVGLNKDLSYSIAPKTIKVRIQDRRTKEMPIQVKFNKDSLAPGYEAGTPTLSAQTAEVTGGKGVISRVYQVVANVVLRRNTKRDVSQQVILQALDDKGNTVNVVVSPETVNVKLPVSLASKSVAVNLNQTGTVQDQTEYTLSTKTKRVTIYGSKAALKKIDALDVAVDVTGITKSTTKTYKITSIDRTLVGGSPSSISVRIKVASTGAASAESSGDTSSSSN